MKCRDRQSKQPPQPMFSVSPWTKYATETRVCQVSFRPCECEQFRVHAFFKLLNVVSESSDLVWSLIYQKRTFYFHRCHISNLKSDKPGRRNIMSSYSQPSR